MWRTIVDITKASIVMSVTSLRIDLLESNCCFVRVLKRKAKLEQIAIIAGIPMNITAGINSPNQQMYSILGLMILGISKKSVAMTNPE